MTTKVLTTATLEKATLIRKRIGGFQLFVFIALHVPLALLMREFPTAGTLHALATIIVGIVFATSRRGLHRVVYIAVYIAGTEVLWRMLGANPLWETGKYAVILILGVALLHKRLSRRRSAVVPRLLLLYIVLLLPSAVHTISLSGLALARDPISFNLSGALALFVSAVYFRNTRMSLRRVEKLLGILVAPIVGIASLSTLDTLLATEIEFSTQSNFITAGGFGPNQVSALLGLGVLAVCILVFCFKRSRSFRYVFLAIGLWFLAQAVLTFSRGGVLNGLLPILAIVVYLLRSPEQRKTAFVTLLIGVLAFSSFLLPELDRFTQGVLQQRFGELDTSGRDVLVQADLQAFLDNPITGAGVGQSVLYHRFYLNKDVSSHTEYTRLFAEHGLLGIFSLLMLGILLLRNIRRNQDSPLVKTIVIALMMWALLYMSHSAMRTVAPSLMLGLTFARFVKEKPKP